MSGKTQGESDSTLDGVELMTVAEVCRRLRHGRTWLYEQIRAGRFPPGACIGRRRFWRRREVEEALRAMLIPS